MATSSLLFALGSMVQRARELGRRVAREGFLWWRRKDPAELERLRRLDVNQRGRISAGRVVDLLEAESAGLKSSLVVYSYEVAGVTYEAAQDVTALPEFAATACFLSGRTASVKYDPKRPVNSIIACEEWSGLGSKEKEAGDSEPASGKSSTQTEAGVGGQAEGSKQEATGIGGGGEANQESKIQDPPSPRSSVPSPFST